MDSVYFDDPLAPADRARRLSLRAACRPHARRRTARGAQAAGEAGRLQHRAGASRRRGSSFPRRALRRPLLSGDRAPKNPYPPAVLASPARSDARRLVRLLRVDGRPRRVHETGGPVPLVQLEQRLERLRLLVDPLPRVAVRRQPLGHARDRQLVGVERVDLVPGQRAPTPARRDGRAPTTRRRRSCAARSGCSRRRRGGRAPPSTTPR